METEATELIEEGGKVVGVKAKNKDEEFEIRAKLVVGADGRSSTIRKAGKFEVENLSVPIDVLWFRIGRTGEDDKQSLGYLAKGHALVMLDRREYWQCAFMIKKDTFTLVKAEGLEKFRETVASVGKILNPQALMEIDSWDKVKLLSVTIDHVKQWAKEGVLLVGDSAHAMSPLGGVGINYAIHDAVAAGNILVPAFKKNDLSLSVLQRLQAKREKPVKRMQKIQAFAQDHVLSPLLNKDEELTMPWFLNFFLYFPILRRIPARVLGIGFGPEHVEISFE
jgi:2-polyprenyl-6-methoxyphenol hydroxylase-like FAD-dependent oxidoreductase